MLFIEARLVSAWDINIYSTAIKDQMFFFWTATYVMALDGLVIQLWRQLFRDWKNDKKKEWKEMVILCSNVYTFYEKKP